MKTVMKKKMMGQERDGCNGNRPTGNRMAGMQADQSGTGSVDAGFAGGFLWFLPSPE